MRVYFNLANGSESIRDEEGVVVSDVDHARAEALSAVGDLRGEKGAEPPDWIGWRLDASDQEGTLLFSLDLGFLH